MCIYLQIMLYLLFCFAENIGCFWAVVVAYLCDKHIVCPYIKGILLFEEQIEYVFECITIIQQSEKNFVSSILIIFVLI